MTTQIRFERLRPVLQRLGLAKTAYYNAIKDGLFTEPLHIGKLSVWPGHEIDAIVAARVRGLCDDSIRMLVKDLMARRKTAGLQQQDADAGVSA